jgi:hypothetical protein
MSALIRLLKEPLFHFALIGVALFWLFSARNEPVLQNAETIIITPQRIEQLRQGYQSVWRSEPTAEQTQALIESYIREEVYYREALSFGLDRDDAVIRQRLRQKMEFLTDPGADLLAPTATELEEYYQANQSVYQAAPNLAFEQVFLGESGEEQAATDLLANLRANAGSDWQAAGLRTMLPASMPLSAPSAINNVFGQDFFDQLDAVEPQLWTGPVISGFGAHLVRITDKKPGHIPALADVEATVTRDWLEQKSERLREQQYEKLRAPYTVEIITATPATVGQ